MKIDTLVLRSQYQAIHRGTIRCKIFDIRAQKKNSSLKLILSQMRKLKKKIAMKWTRNAKKMYENDSW